MKIETIKKMMILTSEALKKCEDEEKSLKYITEFIENISGSVNNTENIDIYFGYNGDILNIEYNLENLVLLVSLLLSNGEVAFYSTQIEESDRKPIKGITNYKLEDEVGKTLLKLIKENT